MLPTRNKNGAKMNHPECNADGCENAGRYDSGYCGICDIAHNDGKGALRSATAQISKTTTAAGKRSERSASIGITASTGNGRARHFAGNVASSDAQHVGGEQSSRRGTTLVGTDTGSGNSSGVAAVADSLDPEQWGWCDHAQCFMLIRTARVGEVCPRCAAGGVHTILVKSPLPKTCFDCGCLIGREWHKPICKHAWGEAAEPVAWGEAAEPVVDIGDVALKFDDGKLPYHLVPPGTTIAIARVLAFGGAKYAVENWRKGFDWHRLHDGIWRHLTQFWLGEEHDRESGEPHLAHLLCMAAFLYEHWEQGLGNDDRIKFDRYALDGFDVREVVARGHAAARK